MPSPRPSIAEATRRPLLRSAARALRSGLVVLVASLTMAAAGLANDTTPAEPVASAEDLAILDARLRFLEERLSKDLNERIAAKSERMIQRATDRYIAAILAGGDPALSMPAAPSPYSPR